MVNVPLWLITITTSLTMALGIMVGWLLATTSKGQHR